MKTTTGMRTAAPTAMTMIIDPQNYDLRSHNRALASWLARYSYGEDADANPVGGSALPPAPRPLRAPSASVPCMSLLGS